ncbi:MAG: bacteriocin [Firmicutes bacterium]|nr:bacteriocin [Bacillota bacterium]
MMSGKVLSENELRKISGGSGSTQGCSVKAVGNPTKMAAKQTKCPKCGSTALTDQRFTTDNGITVYEGQECSCGLAIIYGNNIM